MNLAARTDYLGASASFGPESWHSDSAIGSRGPDMCGPHRVAKADLSGSSAGPDNWGSEGSRRVTKSVGRKEIPGTMGSRPQTALPQRTGVSVSMAIGRRVDKSELSKERPFR